MAKHDHANRHKWKRARNARDETRLLMPPPETYLRVHHVPVERDWQLEKENGSGKPIQRNHARILVEPARGRQYFSFLLPRGPSSPPGIDDLRVSVEDSWLEDYVAKETQCQQPHRGKNTRRKSLAP